MNISEIIIGVMRWGIWGADLSEKEVQKRIETCMEENLYTFDHADIYGGYTTESLFGNAFSEMKIPREKIQLITKCGIEYPGGKKNFELKSYNYSKDYILKCADESLKNLKTDYLDLFLLHRPSPLMNPEEIAAAFGILRAEGKVLNFGVSNFSPSQFEFISKSFPFLMTNQVEFSVNHLNPMYDGVFDQMMIKKLRPMAWSVMGNYFSLPETEQNIRIKSILKLLSEKYGAEENQLLISFILKHPAQIIPIIGTSKCDTIRSLKKSPEIPLSREDWFGILEAIEGKRVP